MSTSKSAFWSKRTRVWYLSFRIACVETLRFPDLFTHELNDFSWIIHVFEAVSGLLVSSQMEVTGDRLDKRMVSKGGVRNGLFNHLDLIFGRADVHHLALKFSTELGTRYRA